MSERDALPQRYYVGRRGTPDPANSSYYVLDVVNDRLARSQLRGLVRAYRLYGSSIAADELEELLNDTQPAHQAAVEAHTERISGKKRRK
jgi:hypothetical protein